MLGAPDWRGELSPYPCLVPGTHGCSRFFTIATLLQPALKEAEAERAILAKTWYELVEKEFQYKGKAEAYTILQQSNVEISRWVSLNYFTREEADTHHKYQDNEEKHELVEESVIGSQLLYCFPPIPSSNKRWEFFSRVWMSLFFPLGMRSQRPAYFSPEGLAHDGFV